MQRYRLYEKTGTDDPPKWKPVDARYRRLSVRPMSATGVLQAMARQFEATPTHVMRGPYDAAYAAGRLLKASIDDRYWLIVNVEDAGKRRRGVGHTAQVRLRVARHRMEDNL